jgi:hypothetical protein
VDLSLASSIFNTIWVDGWDPAGAGTWVRKVSQGTMQVYDRFVSDRTFGEKKRILAIGKRKGLVLPPQYGVIRLPDGKVYMVEYINQDVANDESYSSVYMLHEATFRAGIYEFVASTLPSGLAGPAVKTLVTTYWGDQDKFSSGPSEFEQARRETEAIWLERGAVVQASQQVVVNGLSYMPREITKHADLTFLRVERVTS